MTPSGKRSQRAVRLSSRVAHISNILRVRKEEAERRSLNGEGDGDEYLDQLEQLVDELERCLDQSAVRI